MDIKKTKEPFMADDFFNEEIMNLMADTIQNEIEMDILSHEEREIDIPADFDEKMLSMIREKDLKRMSTRKGAIVKKCVRIAAVILISVFSVGSITMVTSEAFRIKVIDWFINGSDGSVTLRNSDEEEMLGGWKKFWYPTILPEGFSLTSVEEADHFLLYSNTEDELEFRIFEQNEGSMVSVDMDSSQAEYVRIGYSDGYLFKIEDTERFCVTWRTDSLVMMMYFDGDWETNNILEIVEGLDYIEKI